MPWISKKKLETLRGIQAEYEAWIKYAAAGGDYDGFLHAYVLPKDTQAAKPSRVPTCSDLNFHCTFPECGCGR